MTVYVHRNLHHGGWSILNKGKVIARRNRYVLRDAEFRVRPGGHKRALREGRRNVHAFVVGTPGRSLPDFPMQGIRYDLKRGQFTDLTSQRRAVSGAKYVKFETGGRAFAQGLSYVGRKS